MAIKNFESSSLSPTEDGRVNRLSGTDYDKYGSSLTSIYPNVGSAEPSLKNYQMKETSVLNDNSERKNQLSSSLGSVSDDDWFDADIDIELGEEVTEGPPVYDADKYSLSVSLECEKDDFPDLKSEQSSFDEERTRISELLSEAINDDRTRSKMTYKDPHGVSETLTNDDYLFEKGLSEEQNQCTAK